MSAAIVVMAAGLGSRYGGIKQIEGVGPKGEILLEYAVYDALQAGFGQVVLVVKEEILEEVQALCGRRLSAAVQLDYALQDDRTLPDFYKRPPQRVKPLGTVHAVLCAAPYLRGPFAVINADDFYGRDAFFRMRRMLRALAPEGEAAMVGYRLKNTVSPHGTVTRGLCQAKDGHLEQVKETYNIQLQTDGTISSGVEQLDPDSMVSMNFWGMTPWIFGPMEAYFHRFLRQLPTEDNSRECLLPVMVDDLLGEGRLRVAAESTEGSWFGMTYKADRDLTRQALSRLHQTGVYPPSLR